MNGSHIKVADVAAILAAATTYAGVRLASPTPAMAADRIERGAAEALAPEAELTATEPQAAANQSLIAIGSKAPEIRVSKWLKGTPVKEFAPGKTYVVEFWATWCGPCKDAIPHLSKLAKQYRGKVDFVSCSVWETHEAHNPVEAKVDKFMKENGAKMEYAVARDSGNFMGENWASRSGLAGIPAAFIVHDQKVAWIGHPLKLDEPLKQIVGGTFDFETAKDKPVPLSGGLEMDDDSKAIVAAMDQFRTGDADGAVAALYKVADKEAPSQREALSVILIIRQQQTVDKAAREVDKVMTYGAEGYVAAGSYLRGALANPEAKKLLLPRVQKLVSVTDSPTTLFDAAQGLAAAKEYKLAIAAMEKLLASLEKNKGEAATNPEWKAHYEKYLADLKEKAKG